MFRHLLEATFDKIDKVVVGWIQPSGQIGPVTYDVFNLQRDSSVICNQISLQV